MTTVLVTGVGAVIGYGVVRSLRASRRPVRIIGTDIHPDAVGQVWCDGFERAPLTKDPGYPAFLEDLLARRQVDLVLPAIEPDVLFMLAMRERLEKGRTRLALNDPALIALAHDKWLTHERLVALGLPVIPTAIEGDFETLRARFDSPFLLKPRRGSSSRGIVPVSDEEDFRYWRRKMGDEFMAQRIVGRDDGGEYTVGAFGLGDGTASGMIVLERKLSREGATARAWVRKVPAIEARVEELVRALRPLGPTNFQFREHEGEQLLLEINPRLSSSTSLRTAFGFNEAEMCIDYFLEGARPASPAVGSGCAVRYLEDVVFRDRDNL